MDEILLIAADWQFRALVRAQLLEEGYEVTALPSLEMGLAYLLRNGKPPRVLVFDGQGAGDELGLLTDLWLAADRAPLILCGGALDRAVLRQEVFSAARLLLRPFRVRDVIEEVKRALSGARRG